MNTQTLTQKFEELTKGCNEDIGYDNVGGRMKLRYCNQEHLCPTCKAKLQTFISVCEDELEFLVDVRFNSEGYESNIDLKIMELKKIIHIGKEILQ